MSNDIQKADQIAHRFYTKLCLVVSNARTTVEPRSQGKADKWFNLETPDSDIFKDHLRIYRAVSYSPSPPPFELQVLLSVPELTNNQVLVYLAPDSSRVRMDPTPQHILLENWLLTFSPIPTSPQHSVEPGDVAPSTIYKHGIPLFRSLFSLLRILPSWKLFRKLRRRMSTPYRNGNLTIQLRIKSLKNDPTDVLDFDSSPAPNTPPLPYETHTFPFIPHPMGTLSLTAKYLTSPNFQLDELESLLSSRFLSLDEGPDFTPTLVKNQQRDSMPGLPGSLRTSLPKSPPSSIAGQFVLPPPPHSRTNSLPGSQSPRSAALPMSRTSTNMATAGSTSALSVTSSRPEGSTVWSKEDGAPVTGVAARIRKESTSFTGKSSLDLPSVPGPLPIRRPNINHVHPFKSSTLSSGSPSIHSPSPSLRQPSPLASGVALPSLPSRPTQTSPNSSRVPPSPIGVNRPSPPFAASSLGDRRSLASAEGEDSSPRLPPRKRYSSSFGHRYATSGGATSDGSPGSITGAERKDGERSGGNGTAGGGSTPAFLGSTTDDDDISIFVQEIDARKPLASVAARQPLSSPSDGLAGGAASPVALGRRDIPELFDPAASRPQSTSAAGSGGTGAGMGLGLVAGERPRHSSGGMSASDDESKRSSTSMGPMLTREAEVDKKLRHMHEVFLASLEGLGSGSSRKRDNASGRSGFESASGVVRGEDSAPVSRPSSWDGGGGGSGLGVVLPSGLGRERSSGSLRSVSAMEVGPGGRQAGLSGRQNAEGDSPRRSYGE
ncbi:autophagy-related protein 13-domain-containing protein [Boletus reticuloceps]|uniref:Autophagy-related protein 13 n=1 Tax=Boletus reticuloceps TaxID=495285 RepID=A0A8I2YFM7_9AGAM|nr:autophagy-related protein 13-domain-containing protein [Boletus reticuloceps]